MRIERKEYNGSEYVNIQVSRLDTKGKILDIVDTTNVKGGGNEVNIFEKVTINIVSYGENKESIALKYFMDLDEFLSVAYAIMNNRELNYRSYKGTKSSKYDSGYESRCLSVCSWAEGLGGKGAYTIEIITGEGVAGELGQVMPKKGAPVISLKMVVPIPEANRAFTYAYAYFSSKVYDLGKAALRELERGNNRSSASYRDYLGNS